MIAEHGQTVRHLIGDTFHPDVYVLVAENLVYPSRNAIAAASYEQLGPQMESLGPIEKWYLVEGAEKAPVEAALDAVA